MASVPPSHLPTTLDECRQRGWNEVDIILVTGDAYVDHPSFGVALIGRLLESRGFKVVILPQPAHDSPVDFTRFGRPRLFFGITAGNLDSIVANYSGSGKVRDHDAYSSNGSPWWPGERHRTNRKRPDRATIVYANLARAAYPETPVILGGVEASLRRFVHWDYKQNRLRGSVLTDAKADLLVYGMGERAIIAAANHCGEGRPLTGIEGCCERLTDRQFTALSDSLPADGLIQLPSWQEIQKEPTLFLDAELRIDRHARAGSSLLLAQRQQSGWVLQRPAQESLTEKELDDIYELPFTRAPHPQAGDIPAHRMIRHSVTIVRGCSGNCAFCAITRHQGASVQSRSDRSIIKEVRNISRRKDFDGTISDLGGPTANLFATSCRKGDCDRRDCLHPRVCPHLQTDEERMLRLLDSISSIKEVKHVFISSGLRMELLLQTPNLLRRLLEKHTPGVLKIAPEHTDETVLKLMHKEPHSVLCELVEHCHNISPAREAAPRLSPYIIVGHPGSSEAGTRELVRKLKKLGLRIHRFQDFTPTPGTLSTAMFVTGRDTSKKEIHIPSAGERKKEREILERAFYRPSSSAKRPTRKKKRKKN